MTTKEPFEAVVEVIGEEIRNLRGFKRTRLRTPHVAGATTLEVESAYGMSTPGTVLVEGERTSKAYTGVDLTPGAQELTGVDALEYDHTQGDEVVDWTRDSSKMDLLRRSLLIDYAEGGDLDRATRLETERPRGFSDDEYRALAKVLSYLHRGPIYAFELVLDAIYPSGGWSIYESLIEDPGIIYITIPGAVGDTEEGRTYMNARFQGDSDTASQVTVSDTPTSVISIKVAPYEAELLMGVLPSADTPAWTYVAESVGAEGTYFSVSGGVLTQTMPAGADCGKYELSVPELGEFASFEIWWKPGTLTTIAGYPWKLGIEMLGREVVAIWNDTTIRFGQFNDSFVGGSSGTISTGWHGIRIIIDGANAKLYLNSELIATEALTSFAVSSNKKFTFGYVDNSNVCEWDVDWDNALVYAKDSKNYWNLALADGSLAAASDILTTVSTWWVVGDISKRVFLDAPDNENYGLWSIIARPSTSTVQLDGIERTGYYTNSLTPDRIYSLTPRFHAKDDGKDFTISGSGTTPSNNDTYPVLEVISSKEIKVDITGHGSDLVTEIGLTGKYTPGFVTDSSIPWELVDAGTFAAAVLTLHGGVALPQATQPVEAQYTTVESAQVLLDENEVNAGSGGTPERYPFYVYGVNERIQGILDDVSVAGAIPRYFIGY